MPGPLDCIRIVDVTTMISGPLATMILADQGAEVIKIENPKGGDHSRQVADRRGGFAASFLNNNRNKRSVTLNLKDPRGIEAVLKLCETADVFIQNFRPGVAERLGLGPDAVRQARPDIVYASIAGFGFEGEWAKRPVYDPLIQAMSGLAVVQGGSHGRPRLIRTVLPDKVTAIQASQAITAALLSRARTGKGTELTLSMLDTVVAFLWSTDMGGYTFEGDEADEAPLPLDDGDSAQSFVELIYQTADGFMAVSAHTDSTWKGLCAAAGKPEWLADARFETVALREINKAERLELTQSELIEDTTEHWMERLTANDVPCAPVLTRGQMIAHPQVRANGALLSLDHPEAGRIRQARAPARFTGTPLDAPRPARRLGADTEAVLTEVGYSLDAIASLIEVGVATGPQEPNE